MRIAREGDVFCDLGCGQGVICAGMRNRVASIYASDIDPECIDDTAKTLAVNNMEVDLRWGDLFEPFGDARFDLIGFNPPADRKDVAERAILESPAHLNRDGRLVMVVPGYWGIEYMEELMCQAGLLPRRLISIEIPLITPGQIQEEISEEKPVRSEDGAALYSPEYWEAFMKNQNKISPVVVEQILNLGGFYRREDGTICYRLCAIAGTLGRFNDRRVNVIFGEIMGSRELGDIDILLAELEMLGAFEAIADVASEHPLRSARTMAQSLITFHDRGGELSVLYAVISILAKFFDLAAVVLTLTFVPVLIFSLVTLFCYHAFNYIGIYLGIGAILAIAGWLIFGNKYSHTRGEGNQAGTGREADFAPGDKSLGQRLQAPTPACRQAGGTCPLGEEASFAALVDNSDKRPDLPADGGSGGAATKGGGREYSSDLATLEDELVSFTVIDTHNHRAYGDCIRILKETGIKIRSSAVLIYNMHFDQVIGEIRERIGNQTRLLKSAKGEISESDLAELVADTNPINVILAGKYYRGCHAETFRSLLVFQNNRNANYHFIGDMVYDDIIGDGRDSLATGFFARINYNNSYCRIAKAKGFNVDVYLNNKKLYFNIGYHEISGAAQVNLYYWTTFSEFANRHNRSPVLAQSYPVDSPLAEVSCCVADKASKTEGEFIFHWSMADNRRAQRACNILARKVDRICTTGIDWPKLEHSLYEAVKNAFSHGNSFNPEKEVKLTYCVMPDSARFEVQDQGGKEFEEDDYIFRESWQQLFSLFLRLHVIFFRSVIYGLISEELFERSTARGGMRLGVFQIGRCFDSVEYTPVYDENGKKIGGTLTMVILSVPVNPVAKQLLRPAQDALRRNDFDRAREMVGEVINLARAFAMDSSGQKQDSDGIVRLLRKLAPDGNIKREELTVEAVSEAYVKVDMISAEVDRAEREYFRSKALQEQAVALRQQLGIQDNFSNIEDLGGTYATPERYPYPPGTDRIPESGGCGMPGKKPADKMIIPNDDPAVRQQIELFIERDCHGDVIKYMLNMADRSASKRNNDLEELGIGKSELYEKFLQCCRAFSSGGYFLAYLRKAVKGMVIDAIKKRLKQDRMEIKAAEMGGASGKDDVIDGEEIFENLTDADEGDSALDYSVSADKLRLTARALLALREPFRSAIIQAILGLSMDEIARRNNIPFGTVRSRLYQARDIFRQKIAQLWTEAGYGQDIPEISDFHAGYLGHLRALLRHKPVLREAAPVTGAVSKAIRDRRIPTQVTCLKPLMDLWRSAETTFSVKEFLEKKAVARWDGGEFSLSTVKIVFHLFQRLGLIVIVNKYPQVRYAVTPLLIGVPDTRIGIVLESISRLPQFNRSCHPSADDRADFSVYLERILGALEGLSEEASAEDLLCASGINQELLLQGKEPKKSSSEPLSLDYLESVIIAELPKSVRDPKKIGTKYYYSAYDAADLLGFQRQYFCSYYLFRHFKEQKRLDVLYIRGISQDGKRSSRNVSYYVSGKYLRKLFSAHLPLLNARAGGPVLTLTEIAEQFDMNPTEITEHCFNQHNYLCNSPGIEVFSLDGNEVTTYTGCYSLGRYVKQEDLPVIREYLRAHMSEVRDRIDFPRFHSFSGAFLLMAQENDDNKYVSRLRDICSVYGREGVITPKFPSSKDAKRPRFRFFHTQNREYFAEITCIECRGESAEVYPREIIVGGQPALELSIYKIKSKNTSATLVWQGYWSRQKRRLVRTLPRTLSKTEYYFPAAGDDELPLKRINWESGRRYPFSLLAKASRLGTLLDELKAEGTLETDERNTVDAKTGEMILQVAASLDMSGYRVKVAARILGIERQELESWLETAGGPIPVIRQKRFSQGSRAEIGISRIELLRLILKDRLLSAPLGVSSSRHPAGEGLHSNSPPEQATFADRVALDNMPEPPADGGCGGAGKDGSIAVATFKDFIEREFSGKRILRILMVGTKNINYLRDIRSRLQAFGFDVEVAAIDPGLSSRELRAEGFGAYAGDVEEFASIKPEERPDIMKDHFDLIITNAPCFLFNHGVMESIVNDLLASEGVFCVRYAVSDP
ncbi:MAG: methyltransferase, partial [Candidatus Omnitrophota bacterium]